MATYQEVPTVKAIADGLAKGEFSSREITERCLRQIETTDGVIKAFNLVTTNVALKAADASDERRRNGRPLGPLDGVPYAAKDLVETAGIETTGSSKVLAGNVPTRDASTVERLNAAGAVLIGKTNTHQFAYGVQTPPTRNPWDMELARVPGGSSGGTGAAVATTQIPLGLGTDTGGSIRIPACLNGITGLKATFGRIPKDGVFVLSYSRDNIGPMCRTAEDAALTLNVLAGRDARDPNSSARPTEDYTAALATGVMGLRIAVPTNYFVSHYPAVTAAFRAAAEQLRALGADLFEVTVPQSVAQAPPAGFIVTLAESAAWHGPRLRRQGQDYGDDVRRNLQLAELVLATDYINAKRFRSRFIADMRQHWRDERIDVMITPTIAVTAARHGQMEYEAPDGFSETLMAASTRCTSPFNLTGQPALTVPCGFDEKGLPVGLQIVARPWEEALVLRVGHAYQQATDWHARRPDLAAPDA